MEEEDIRDDGLNMDDLYSNPHDTVELAYTSDSVMTEDKSAECVHRNQAEDSDANSDEEEYDDEVDEEEDDDDEDTYTLRFEGEVNPLALTEVDAFGIQPYQHLERMEYEALAAKKRKANLECDNQGMPCEKKLRQEDYPDESIADLNKLMEEMYGNRRKSKKIKQRGRRKGSRKKVNPEITRKLGDATLYYAHGRYEEAIPLLKDIILISPNLPDPYHTLGLIYNAMGDKKRALDFYMLAVHLTPKDASLWKLLITWSLEQGNHGQACYCLDRAIRADPEDMGLRYHRASLYVELGEHHKGAVSYEHIWQLRPKNLEALKTAATLYQKSGDHERSINILEEYLKKNPTDADMSVLCLLASVLMAEDAHEKALLHIESAQHNNNNNNYSNNNVLPVELLIKAGICHVHLGNMEKAEAFFSVLTHENVNDFAHLVIEAAKSLMSVKQHGSALKYCLMLEGSGGGTDKGLLFLNIGRCYSFLNSRTQAIDYFYKALNEHEDDVGARLELVSLLLEENKGDEAVCVLSPPHDSESRVAHNSNMVKPWWTDEKVKLKLSYIYKSKGSTESFVETIFPLVRETLYLETIQRKRIGRRKKKIPVKELLERARVLDELKSDSELYKFRPVASAADISKALRAKKLLEKKEAEKEEKRAAALAAGVEWQSDDSDGESRVYREPPMPNLLKDGEHLTLIVDLSNALISLQRYWEALEIINSSLKLAHTLTTEVQEELRSLGTQIAYKIDGPANGWDCARHIVSQNPYSFAAWNCYYKIMSRSKLEKHSKFLHEKLSKHEDSVPPILIKGHQRTMNSKHQEAACHYLKAYKLMPDNPLINLCVGTALINLALGFRLHNKHQCVLQGLAFLYNNLRLSGNNQEALYNLARAYHHVGLITIAATYYEKVLAIHQKDHPIPKLPNDGTEVTSDLKPGYCDLKREAAYNLHLIYKSSGSMDLARQVLKDHCSL